MVLVPDVDNLVVIVALVEELCAVLLRLVKVAFEPIGCGLCLLEGVGKRDCRTVLGHANIVLIVLLLNGSHLERVSMFLLAYSSLVLHVDRATAIVVNHAFICHSCVNVRICIVHSIPWALLFSHSLL